MKKTCGFILQNRILWVDEKNMTMRAECGIIGQDLERKVSDFIEVFVETARKG